MAREIISLNLKIRLPSFIIMESIGVIGVGRLGICTALLLEKAGYSITCYDRSTQICQAINTRSIVSAEKGVPELLANAKNISAVDSIGQLVHLDTFFCVVATPSLPDGAYDHTNLDAVAEQLLQCVPIDSPKRKILNVCCTTMPGYCDSLQKKFDQHNIPVDVCYNPEFIAQGNILYGFTHPDIVLIGEANKESGDRLEGIYKAFVQTTPTVCRMTRKEAEITKISINCFVTTKISFANTIGDLCVKEGLNADRVLSAIGGDSRVGKKYLGWGHGYGGPCFPRDNRALCLYCACEGIPNRIGMATDQTNASHLEFLVQTLKALKQEVGKDFLFRDLAYKPGTIILEESQSLALAQRLDLEGFPIYVQESPEIKKELESQARSRFLFVDDSVEASNYIVVDKDLSCLRMRM
jgi:UDPglucose 6-dehydrogenase